MRLPLPSRRICRGHVDADRPEEAERRRDAGDLGLISV